MLEIDGLPVYVVEDEFLTDIKDLGYESIELEDFIELYEEMYD